MTGEGVGTKESREMNQKRMMAATRLVIVEMK